MSEATPAPASPATTVSAGPRSWPLAAAGLLALLHFAWLAAHWAPAIMSPDANGYVAQARLIAEEGRTGFTAVSPVQYVGMHWLETGAGGFHSRYPAGLPLLMAGLWKLGGIAAALWLNPLLASATVLLVFFLARRFAPPAFALLAAAVIAVVPATNQHALDADAHVAATFFLVAGVLALLRFGEAGGRGWGLLAGLLLGAVPTMRYPEAIVGLAIAGWLAWRVRPLGRIWPAVLGALLPLGALGVHNTAAYGAFWRTGYALTNEQTGFGLRYFTGHAVPYLQALGGQGLALMFAFGVAGLAALVADPRHRREGVLLAGLSVPLVLVYMAYYFGGGGPGGAMGNLRFLIPTFPFFATAAVWLLAHLAGLLGSAGRAAVGAVAAVQLLTGLVSSQQVLASADASLGAAARARRVAEKEIPAGSVVILDRQLAESLDAVGRWKLVEESRVAGPAGPGFAGPGGRAFPAGPGGRGGLLPPGRGGAPRPLPGGEEAADDDPSPMQRGKNRAQLERYAGLRPAERQAKIWEDIRAWAGGRPVFWFARSLDQLDEALPEGFDYRSIAEVDAPSMLGPGGGGGGGPGGPGMPATRAGKSGPGRGFAGPAGSAGPGGAPRGLVPPGGPAGPRGPSGAGGKLRLVRLMLPKP